MFNKEQKNLPTFVDNSCIKKVSHQREWSKTKPVPGKIMVASPEFIELGSGGAATNLLINHFAET